MGEEDSKPHASNSSDEVDRTNEVIERENLIPEDQNSEPIIVETQSPTIVENHDEGEEYSCKPPKLFIPTITLLQIIFFLLS